MDIWFLVIVETIDKTHIKTKLEFVIVVSYVSIRLMLKKNYVTNGVKQGGILSLTIFNMYMYNLSVLLTQSSIGMEIT